MSAGTPARRFQAYVLCLALVLSGCAHTKPVGQALVALGALIAGLGTLDAIGVLGDECKQTRTPEGASVASCSGSGVTPQPDALNVLGIALGAAMIGGGIALWTMDSHGAPKQAPNSVALVPTAHGSSVVQPKP